VLGSDSHLRAGNQHDRTLHASSRFRFPFAPMKRILFNIPPVVGSELSYLARVLEKREFSGNGEFTGRCHAWLKRQFGGSEALITPSCTAALEMAAILAELAPGDEVIMPSFTFVSTANAVVLRGAVPVFVDIRPDTQNIDERLIAAAITKQTKAICAVHYAGICAEMDPINELARSFNLLVMEDAAQALLSTYHGRPAGSLSDLSCFSFHETKNVCCGEGGALVVNSPHLAERAYVVWEKGTNRRAFKQGRVDKYQWMDLGSSFLPSEFTAAVLLAQLEQAQRLCSERIQIWHRYHDGFQDLETAEAVRRPTIPPHCQHNGHLYYLILRDQEARDRLIRRLADDLVDTVFHYVPLHSSPAGLRLGRAHGPMPITDRTSAGLIRLPLHAGMDVSEADRVIERIHVHLSETGC
jgi:dTDP-4-amino-4,6-dideoxygalactose transaminase